MKFSIKHVYLNFNRKLGQKGGPLSLQIYYIHLLFNFGKYLCEKLLFECLMNRNTKCKKNYK